MEGVEGWAGNEGRLVGDPEVAHGLEGVCEDNSLLRAVLILLLRSNTSGIRDLKKRTLLPNLT